MKTVLEGKPSILMVEDDEGLCGQYRWAFPTFAVLLAQSRSQALAIAEKANPPVIVMDLGLPPDPDGVSEGFFARRALPIATGKQNHSRHWQWGACACAACDRGWRVRLLRKAGRDRCPSDDYRSVNACARSRSRKPSPAAIRQRSLDREDHHFGIR